MSGEPTSVLEVLGFLATGLGYLAMEFLAEVTVALVLDWAWTVIRAPFRSSTQAHPLLQGVGLLAAGAAVGVLSYVLRQERVLVDPGPRGLSLVLAPLAVGGVMEFVGRWQSARRRPAPAIASLEGGVVFAFAMAATRYMLFFRPGAW